MQEVSQRVNVEVAWNFLSQGIHLNPVLKATRVMLIVLEKYQ